jgi:DNA-directed RNA polymerase specialized sigma24 family protein
MLTADHTQQIMALEELFKSHYYPLRAYALRFICNREMAEDMVQDALFELWSRRDTIRFDDKNAVKSYLFKSIHKGSVYDYGVLFPIPQREMDANAYLKQNPGY